MRGALGAVELTEREAPPLDDLNDAGPDERRRRIHHRADDTIAGRCDARSYHPGPRPRSAGRRARRHACGSTTRGCRSASSRWWCRRRSRCPRSAATAATWCAFTVSSTASCGPASRIVPTARAPFDVTSAPSSPMTRIPFFAMASRFGPRAMNVTSSPAADSHPPRKPPIAPAPTTAIFIARSRITACASA